MMTAKLPQFAVIRCHHNRLYTDMTAFLPSCAVTLIVASEVTPLFTLKTDLALLLMPYQPNISDKKAVGQRIQARPLSLPVGVEHTPVHRDSEHRISPPKGQNPLPGETPEYPLPRRKSNRTEESI